MLILGVLNIYKYNSLELFSLSPSRLLALSLSAEARQDIYNYLRSVGKVSDVAGDITRQHTYRQYIFKGENALAAQPYFAPGHAYIAYLYSAIGDCAQALQSVSRARALSPTTEKYIVLEKGISDVCAGSTQQLPTQRE